MDKAVMEPLPASAFWGTSLHSALLLCTLLSLGGGGGSHQALVDLGSEAGDPYVRLYRALVDRAPGGGGSLRVLHTVQPEALLLAAACLPAHVEVSLPETLHVTMVERTMPTLLRHPEAQFTVAHWHGCLLVDRILVGAHGTEEGPTAG